jgi:hypothetical protein
VLNLAAAGAFILGAACLMGAALCGWFWWQDSGSVPWELTALQTEMIEGDGAIRFELIESWYGEGNRTETLESSGGVARITKI